MDALLAFLIFLGGATLGFVIALMLFAGPQNLNDPVRLQAICDCKGGEVKDDVCIKDGFVITIDLPGDN